jgi:predicted RNA-binding protein with PIN domain
MTLPGKAVIIIDGYNAIHRAPLLKKQLDKSLEAARDTLTALCAEWRASRGDVLSIQLVFDGQSRLPDIPSLPRQGVQVSFSRKPQSADEHILALLRNIADAAACVVVSDDREIIRHAVRLGAQPMGVMDFLAMTKRRRRPHDPASAGGAKAALTPAQERRINDELIREWGLE